MRKENWTIGQPKDILTANKKDTSLRVGIIIIVSALLFAMGAAFAFSYFYTKSLSDDYPPNKMFAWKICQAKDVPDNATEIQRQMAISDYTKEFINTPASIIGKVRDVKFNAMDGIHIVLDDPRRERNITTIFAYIPEDEALVNIAGMLSKGDIVNVDGAYIDVCIPAGDYYFIDLAVDKLNIIK